MSEFGDREPEDAWHPHDSITEQLRNLGQRIALLDGEPRPLGSPSALLDSITQRIRASVSLGVSSERQVTRLIQLIEDVALVRSRLS
jgi:hypothetical protein